MPPIDPVTNRSNVLPLTYFSAAVLIAGGSLFSIVRSFTKLRRALPISARTRTHEAQRRKYVVLFAVLAVVSLLVTSYNFIELALDSYSHFVAANSIVPKNDIWSSPLWRPRHDDIKGLQLQAWLDSDDLTNVVEAMFASPRDYWWFQQLQGAIVIWFMFLGVQARRHNIPHTWLYIVLAAVFGLAVPLNLYFIALLLTPVPYDREQSRPRSRSAARRNGISKIVRRLRLDKASSRPATWTPSHFFSSNLVIVAVACQFVTPYIGNQAIRDTVLMAPTIAGFLVFLIEYTRLLPTRFGTTHSTIHAAHMSYKSTFRSASILAFILHAVSTYSAITANAPPVYRPRFHLLDTSGDTVSTVAQSYFFAIAKTLSAFSDSPLVQLVGWDVILSGLSICLWAGVRGLHPSHMLSHVGLPTEIEAPSTAPIKRAAAKAGEKTKRTASRAENAVRSTVDPEDREDTPPATRAGVSKVSKATGTSPPGTSSRRGRPSKAQLQRAAERAEDDEDGEDVDPSFKPSADLADSVEHDEHVETVEPSEQAESTAVAWGMLVLGGLGVAMGGVCGAEVV